MRCHLSLLITLLLGALGPFQAAAQAPNSAWVYPSATGNLLYQLDSRGQRITDFSQCGYRGGTEPLPNVTALIPQGRWVYVSPADGDDKDRIQAAIHSVSGRTPDANGWRGVVYLNAGEYQLARTLNIAASGVVLKGAGNASTNGTRLRATDPRRYTLISLSGSGSRYRVSNTTRNLTQKLVPAGARTFEVDSTSGLAVGHTVIVKRTSTANWIVDLDMDQLDNPWTEGSKDLSFDRTITRIDGKWITVDIPLPQTFESTYGGGQIWRYTWSERIQQSGIEDIYGISDYAHSTDENHAWDFIEINNAQHVWVRNITAQHFGYSAVSVGDGAKWLTVADSQCLDPISVIDGGRRYSFNNEGAECTLFVNNYARKGRHDFVFGSVVPGPNAFVHCTADTAYSDTGPHHRWSVGGLFDFVTVNGNEINVRNRGNSGTGHGWAGAYMTVWNCKASTFRVRNPPTARNWLVGSIGTIGTSSGFSVGADPAGTYDSSGPTSTGKGVYPRSLYYGQLQQRMKWPDSEFREVWLGDVDQHYSTGGTGNPVSCDTTWLAQVAAIDALPADAKFDFLVGNRYTACTLDFSIDPADTIVAASLTVSLRGVGSAASDKIWLDGTASPQSYASLGWTPISTTAPTVRTMEVPTALLTDGRLNLAFGKNTAVDFAVLHLQVQKAQPATATVTLAPVADTMVRGGDFANTNYGTTASLETKGIDTGSTRREAFLRWDLTGVSGKIVQAKVRLAGTSASQLGNENFASFVSNDTWGETVLTFNNKPTSGKLFAQWLPVTGQAVEFDVTPQIADTLLSDKKLSLRIAATDNQGDSGNVNYASRENATTANRPQLILTFEGPAPPFTVINTGSKVVVDTPGTALETAVSSMTFNAGAGTDLLVVAISSEKSSEPYRVSYHGVDLTLAVAGTAGSSADIWYLKSPYTGGAADLVVDMTGVSVVNGYGLGVMSVDAKGQQMALHATAKSIEGSHQSVTLSTTAEHALVVTSFNSNDAGGSASVNHPLTPIYVNTDIGSARGAAGYQSRAVAGSHTYWWTVSSNPRSAVAAAFVIQPAYRFADWIALYPGLGGQTGFNDDPDGDGNANGVEGWFGTNPAAGNAGLTQLSNTGSVFRFQHPVADPALTDVTGSYEWSLDLATWHPDTTNTVGETAVTISATTDSGTTTVAADTTGSITPPATLFLRAVATQN